MGNSKVRTVHTIPVQYLSVKVLKWQTSQSISLLHKQQNLLDSTPQSLYSGLNKQVLNKYTTITTSPDLFHIRANVTNKMRCDATRDSNTQMDHIHGH